MDDVNVHFNSSQPAQLTALAYTQGSDIHVAPGQERHLPHEAWHVVQQAQGRVKPTMQMKDGVPVNDDEGLEREADVMGAKALAPAAQLSGGPEEDELLQGKVAPVTPSALTTQMMNIGEINVDETSGIDELKKAMGWNRLWGTRSKDLNERKYKN